MTYNFTYELLEGDLIQVTRQDENANEYSISVAMKDFFECAQFLGLFPEGYEFTEQGCMLQFQDDGLGNPTSKPARYDDLMCGLTFGDDDIQKICARLFNDEIPQIVYWVCAASTLIIRLEFKGFFNGPVFSKELLEYVGPGIERLIFKDEINGQSLSFFTNEIEAKKRLKENLQMSLRLIDRELDEYYNKLSMQQKAEEFLKAIRPLPNPHKI